MIERLLVLIALTIVAVLGYAAVSHWQIGRARSPGAEPLLAELRPGIPAIVYFASPFCGPCAAQQRPAIDRVLRELGGRVQVVEVDTTEQPDTATRWGVMTLPTTFILDRWGRPRQVNNGVAGPDKLKQQLQSL